MSTRVSVVIPVKDGARYLPEVLEALERESPAEVLVIDSGSADASVQVARGAGVDVLEIPPANFGHGRTRNLGAEHTSGELICFLTQDATPMPGWLQAYEEAFALDERVGAAYGPHLPRAGTSPMIARELTEFFAEMSPRGGTVLHRHGDRSFLSNVNAAYRRACWEEVRFRDLAYSEDQAFGKDMLAAGWLKAYVPAAAVLHAHDFSAIEFMRRYFDEYRGLRHSVGHVEPFSLGAAAHDVRASIRADRAWVQRNGAGKKELLRWTGRSLVHHGGRKLFSALGSRAPALPNVVERTLSLERRPVANAAEPIASGLQPVAKGQERHEYEHIAHFFRAGPAPLLDAYPGMGDKQRLHVAAVIPPFRTGSGGHNIVMQLLHRLEQRGHTASVWLHDPFRLQRDEWPAVMRRVLVERFAPINAPVCYGFDGWRGADVALATGWETVYPVLGLLRCRARAYLVNDHEPEFFPTSVESEWARKTYELGLHGIAGSPWLQELYTERYGGTCGTFHYGVDHDVYKPRPVRRRRDTVIFYSRTVTQRRAVAMGILALTELRRRRPDVRIVTFGDIHSTATPYPHEHLGIATPEQLSWAFSEATVGLCLSLTNFSLVPQEMLACGLPCVDINRPSAESVFGRDSDTVVLAPFDADALADAMQALLEDRDAWQRRSEAGIELVRDRTWDRATDEVERELRNALRVNELAVLS
jgi:glycosyltransferase involved in cell wall biosynthesis